MTIEESPISVTPEAIISLEQSYIKVPWEQARRCFRGELKVVDKELAQLCGVLADININDTDKRSKLLSKVKSISEKLQQQSSEARKFRRRVEARLGEITKITESDEKSSSTSHIETSRWLRNRAFRVIAEYLLQKGYDKAALALVRQYGLQDQVDSELYSESLRVKSSLRSGNATECLSWCSENRTFLKKNKSPIEFMLRRQELVELVRNGDLSTALTYARKHFPVLFEFHEAEVEQALALFAISPKTNVMPYRWVYDPNRWNDIALQFDRDNQALHGLPDRPQLVSLVHAGLAALKTPQCQSDRYLINECTKQRSINCPVCSDPLSSISKLLPFAHHETSLLVCPISGMIMDADNAPMVLPNGYVYSLRALEQMAGAMGGNVICPRTKATFRLVEVRKCFIS